MDIQVSGVDDAQPVPAAPGSPLINLRAQRQRKLDALHLDLEVPRWGDAGGPQVWIRYRPASMSVGLNATEKRRGQKADEWVTLANADVLVDACIGVYVKVDGKPFTLTTTGDWVGFDPDNARPDEWVSVKGTRVEELAAALGVDERTAAGLLRSLFFTDGDLMGHSVRLNEFSAQAAPEADKESLGE